MINQARSEGGKIKLFLSYGSGTPSFEHNNNPYGYKFSWSPCGLLKAGQTPAAYVKNGKDIEISGEDLFENSWLVDVDGLGVFETYANRDTRNYIKTYGLEEATDFYRGLLKHPGY